MMAAFAVRYCEEVAVAEGKMMGIEFLSMVSV
jgi:hypothetical protein